MTVSDHKPHLLDCPSYPEDAIEPVIRGDYPDPTILRVGADYYMTHSANTYAPALLIWHSSDLINWRPVAHALTEYGQDIWAPDLAHYEGKFYIYFTTSGRNKVIVAGDIAGPWSSPADLNVPHIDPGHLTAADGQRFLHLSGGHLIALSEDGLSTQGVLRKVYDGWPVPFPTRIEGYAEEGPKPFRKDGWYYLVTAQGGTAGPAGGHMAVIARSRNVDGPWENAARNPLIRTADRHRRWWCRGHATIFETADGDWRILYHAYEKGYISLGRHTFIQKIRWNEDGWPEVMDEPQPAVPPQMPLSDHFSGPDLGWQWQFQGEFDRNRYCLLDGSLVLKARGTSPSEGSSVLCIRPQHTAYEVEVDIEIQGDKTEAGLLLYYNENAFTGLALTGGQIIMRLRRDRETALRGPIERATLRIVNDHHEIDYFVRLAGEDWRQIPRGVEISGWNHNSLGGFLGLRAALYASGSGEATFRSFQYRPLQ